MKINITVVDILKLHSFLVWDQDGGVGKSLHPFMSISNYN